MKRPKKPPVKRKECGTYKGRSRHVYYQEETCPDCSDAYADYQRGKEREKRRAKGIRPTLTRVTVDIYTFEEMYWQLSDETRDRLDIQLGSKKIDRIIRTVDELKELDSAAQ